MARTPEYDDLIIRDLTPTHGWIGHCFPDRSLDMITYSGLGHGPWILYLPSEIQPPRLGHGDWLTYLSSKKPSTEEIEHLFDRFAHIWPDLTQNWNA